MTNFSLRRYAFQTGLVLLLSIAILLPAAAQKRWYSQTTSMPNGRQMYGSAVCGDNFYLIGGNTESEGYLLSVQFAPVKQNGQLGAWQETTPLPTARAYINNTTIVLNDIIYIVSGADIINGNKPNSILWTRPSINGHLEPWRTSPPYPGEGVSCSAAVATPGFIHLLGGYGKDSVPITAVWSARVNSDGQPASWDPGPPLPAPLWFHCAGVAANRVWVWGGLTGEKNTTVNTKVFSAPILASGKLGDWQTALGADLPQGFYSASSTVSGSMLLTFCPRYSGGAISNDVWYAQASPNGLSKWTKLPTDLPSKLYIGLGSDYRRGFVYIPGGRVDRETQVMDNNVYFFQLAGSRENATTTADVVAKTEAAVTDDAPGGGERGGGQARLTYTQINQTTAVHPGFVPYDMGRQTAAAQRRPLVLYFYNSRVKRCQEQAEILKSLDAGGWAGKVVLAEVDTAQFPQATQQYGIFRIPHWMVFSATGQQIHSRSGVMSAADLGAAFSQLAR